MAHRIIRDADGREWQVWETYPTGTRLAVSPGYADGWLSFGRVVEPGGADPAQYRLAPIPSGWATLPEQDLLQLLAQAKAVPHRDPRAERPR
jgi:hypothetical protein